ncbi:MAG: hypothetical protein IPP66_20830 [Anaerolineales bacterium]|nr:hypothetical protein [Anaerolineales bacterium]
METIEVPLFLLANFDSMTIRTPLTSIRGYTDVMLEGVAGPITEDQQHYLKIIKSNAERLWKIFGILLDAQRYIVYRQSVTSSNLKVWELMDFWDEEIKLHPKLHTTIKVSDDEILLWGDQIHVHKALECAVHLIEDITTDGLENEITIMSLQNANATTLQFEFSRTDITEGEYFDSYIDPYRFVMQRVMELHNGTFELKDAPAEKMQIILTFPNSVK